MERRGQRTLLNKYNEMRMNFQTAYRNFDKSGQNCTSLALFTSSLTIQYLYCTMKQNNCDDFIVSTICRVMPGGGKDSSDTETLMPRNGKRKREEDDDYADLKGAMLMYLKSMERRNSGEDVPIRPIQKSNSQEEREIVERNMKELDKLKERVASAWAHVEACKHLPSTNTYRCVMTKDYKYWMKKYQIMRESFLCYENDEDEDSIEIDCSLG